MKGSDEPTHTKCEMDSCAPTSLGKAVKPNDKKSVEVITSNDVKPVECFNGYHESVHTKYDADSFVPKTFLKAITSNDIEAVKCMIKDGVNIFEASGTGRRTAMMETIVAGSFVIMDLLFEAGETAGRCYGPDGFTAYHYAIMEEKWASLAHLIRRAGYPLVSEGSHSPIDMAMGVGYWRAVSILEQERDNPGFWRRDENISFGEVHKRLGRLRKPTPGSNEMNSVHAKWEKDLHEYESFAPSLSYLRELGWYDRDVEDRKHCVYSCSSQAFVARKRLKTQEKDKDE